MQFLSALKKGNPTTSSTPVDSQTPNRSSTESKEHGDTLMREAKWAQAAQCYTQTIAVNPTYVAAHINLGFVLMQQGLLEDAQHHLTQALELDAAVADASYLLGTLHLTKGQPAAAEEHFRKALLQAPDFFPAYDSLCALLMQNGRVDDAMQLVRHGAEHNTGNADLHYLLGKLYFSQEQLDQAISSFTKVLELDATHALAHSNLGLALLKKGALNQAVAVLQKAVELDPHSPDLFNDLGSALHSLQRFDEAISTFQQGLSINPHSDLLRENLGLSLHAQERFDEAIAQFQITLSRDYTSKDVHFNLGNSLFAQKKFREAISSYQTFLEKNPQHLNAHNNLGNALQEAGESDAALACFEQALTINPDYAAAHYGKGKVLKSLGKIEEATACFRTAIKNDPDFVEAHLMLGDVLFDLGQLDDAKSVYERVLEIEPNHAGAHWVLAMLTLPAIPATDDEVVASRENFSQALTKLQAWFNGERIDAGVEQVGSLLPFYLTYQEENNRPLLAEYGQLCSRLTKYWSDQHLPALNHPQSDGPVRVGIVSAHIFKNHSVWNALVKGWFDHCNPNRIELHVFYLGSHHDSETEWAKSRSASFESGKRDFAQWAEIIQKKQVDVLIFPEIGMDRLAVKLASLRLAPAQATTWGHPETSGLPTIDYFLSAVDLEPANAQDNYTEKLVLLPKLGCHYYQSEVESINPDMRALGIAPDAPILLCPGTPFKYAPKHDHVFVDIARKLGKCQFVFFAHPLRELADKLCARLKSAFAAAQMDFDDFCVFIPWQDKAAFFGLMKQADVFLDTIGFSGFNTAIQALECDLPIVTREGHFMRGRLASGILRNISLQELVADNEADYVDLVVKLVRDEAYCDTVRQRITSSRASLFNDRSSVQALEEFLVSTANAKRQANSASP